MVVMRLSVRGKEGDRLSEIHLPPRHTHSARVLEFLHLSPTLCCACPLPFTAKLKLTHRCPWLVCKVESLNRALKEQKEENNYLY